MFRVLGFAQGFGIWLSFFGFRLSGLGLGSWFKGFGIWPRVLGLVL